MGFSCAVRGLVRRSLSSHALCVARSFAVKYKRLHNAYVCRDAVEDAVSGLRDKVRADLNNMHMDLIRQFHLQQVTISTLAIVHPLQ